MELINNTVFKIPNNNLKIRIELEIGDSKQSDFYPQIKILRWDNEVNVSIRLVEDKNINETFIVKIEDDIVKYKKEKIECHFYEIYTNEDHPEGASEFEIILKEKPISNIISFSVIDKGVDYHYQPELTEEEIQKGMHRPENVIGSYAIYANEYRHNIIGGKEYKCGKVGHIYRPQIEDANGIKVWGDLNIDKGVLTVTIPQVFLDNAVYPVRHAAGLTYGYTTIGATNDSGNNGYQIATAFPDSLNVVAGTVINSLNSAMWNAGSGKKVKFSLYSSSSALAISGIIADMGEVTITRTTKPTQLSEFTYSTVTGNALSGGPQYYALSFSPDDAGTNIGLDIVAGIKTISNSVSYASVPISTYGGAIGVAYVYSIYMIYGVSLGKKINGITISKWNGTLLSKINTV